jgi:NAD(P)-dependent dehydrogenase (short-subunit alcohol dehydrogenase family)
MSEVIVVTGSGTGMGRLAARSLALAGHTVYASMRGVGTRNRDKTDEIFIPGATPGIGLGFAKRFAAAGNRVVIAGRRQHLIGSSACPTASSCSAASLTGHMPASRTSTPCSTRSAPSSPRGSGSATSQLKQFAATRT